MTQTRLHPHGAPLAHEHPAPHTHEHPALYRTWPGRSSSWVPVAGSAAGALAVCAVVAVADPSVPGRYGICPFYALTGWWCPLCGSLRAMHVLTRGDVAAAASSNLLLLAALPVAVYAWLVWAAPRVGLPVLPRPKLSRTGWWLLLGVALVVLTAFGVARNLEPLAWLAPEVVWTGG